MTDALAYCAYGEHRTGGAGERAVAGWFSQRCRDAGADVELLPFTVPGFVPTNITLRLDGTDIAADALYYSGSTGPEGVRGPLVSWEVADENSIALAEVHTPFNFGMPGLNAVVEKARNTRAQALVAITNGIADGCVQQNVAPSDAPTGVPTLLVAPKDAGPLVSAAGGSSEVFACLDASFTSVTGSNVVAALDGGTGGTLVVLTSLSGWYTCAAERAPGIVGALAILDRYAAMPVDARPGRLVVAATSGHELHHAGLTTLLKSHGGGWRGGRFLQLGASICCTQWNHAQGFVLGFDEGDANALRKMLAEARVPIVVAEPDARPKGEGRDIDAGGWPVVSLSGTHQHFHTPEDVPGTTLSEETLRDADALMWQLSQYLHKTALK